MPRSCAEVAHLRAASCVTGLPQTTSRTRVERGGRERVVGVVRRHDRDRVGRPDRARSLRDELVERAVAALAVEAERRATARARAPGRSKTRRRRRATSRRARRRCGACARSTIRAAARDPRAGTAVRIARAVPPCRSRLHSRRTPRARARDPLPIGARQARQRGRRVPAIRATGIVDPPTGKAVRPRPSDDDVPTVAKAPLSTQIRLDPASTTGAASTPPVIWDVDARQSPPCGLALGAGPGTAGCCVVASRRSTACPALCSTICRQVDLEARRPSEAGDAADDRMGRRPPNSRRGGSTSRRPRPSAGRSFTLGRRRHALVRVWHHILGDALSGRAMNDDLARAAVGACGATPALRRRPSTTSSLLEAAAPRATRARCAAIASRAVRDRLAGALTLLADGPAGPRRPSFGGERSARRCPRRRRAQFDRRRAAHPHAYPTSVASSAPPRRCRRGVAGETDVVTVTAARRLPGSAGRRTPSGCQTSPRPAGDRCTTLSQRRYAGESRRVASEQVIQDRGSATRSGWRATPRRNPPFRSRLRHDQAVDGDLELEGCSRAAGGRSVSARAVRPR